MNIVFLDIDGVLVTRNSVNTHTPHPPCLAALTDLVERTDVRIVLSSDWRFLDTPQNIFTKFGFAYVDHFLGITPKTEDGPRGLQIQAWLDSRATIRDGMIYDKFAIIDDNDDMEHLTPFLFKIDPKDGLTHIDVDRIVGFFLDISADLW